MGKKLLLKFNMIVLRLSYWRFASFLLILGYLDKIVNQNFANGLDLYYFQDLKSAKAIVDWIAWVEPQYNFNPMIDEWCKEASKELDFNHKVKKLRAGIGVVCRDERAELLECMSKKVEVSSAFMAECFALKEAFKFREKFAGSHVCFEMDCEELFRILVSSDGSRCEWQCCDVVQELLELKENSSDISFSLVSRLGNRAADFLAAEACKGMCHSECLMAPASLMFAILFYDSLEQKAIDFKKKGVG